MIMESKLATQLTCKSTISVCLNVCMSGVLHANSPTNSTADCITWDGRYTKLRSVTRRLSNHKMLTHFRKFTINNARFPTVRQFHEWKTVLGDKIAIHWQGKSHKRIQYILKPRVNIREQVSEINWRLSDAFPPQYTLQLVVKTNVKSHFLQIISALSPQKPRGSLGVCVCVSWSHQLYLCVQRCLSYSDTLASFQPVAVIKVEV